MNDTISTNFLRACCDNDMASLRALLAEGNVDVNTAGNDGRTALMLVSMNGHVGIARLLVENGADVNAIPAHGGSGSSLVLAAGEGHATMVRFLIENGADVNALDVLGRTALMFAAINDNIEMTRFLTETGADVNAADVNGDTPLAFASVRGHVDVARFLIEKGADVNVIPARGEFSPSLILAAQYGEVDLVRFLIEKGANVNAVDGNARDTATSAMMAASGWGQVAVVRALIENGADVNTADNNGCTALMFAARAGHMEVARLLIENGADVNAVNEVTRTRMFDSVTALVLASTKKHNDMIRFLIEKGADVNVIPARGDFSPSLILAAQYGEVDLVRFLIEKGANVNGGNAPSVMVQASRHGHVDVARILIENGADVNVVDATGHTALMSAASNGHAAMTRFLIEQGADVNAVDAIDGSTALMHACQQSSYGNPIDVARALIENGADINAVNRNNEDALSEPLRALDIDFVHLLFLNGVDIKNRGNYMVMVFSLYHPQLFRDEISAVMKHCHTIKVSTLFLDHQVTKIVDALKTNNTVTSLDLSGSPRYIQDDQAERIANLLKTNRTIVHVNLCCSNIGARGITALAEVLSENHNILYLGLTDNQSEDTSAEKVEGEHLIETRLKRNKWEGYLRFAYWMQLAPMIAALKANSGGGNWGGRSCETSDEAKSARLSMSSMAARVRKDSSIAQASALSSISSSSSSISSLSSAAAAAAVPAPAPASSLSLSSSLPSPSLPPWSSSTNQYKIRNSIRYSSILPCIRGFLINLPPTDNRKADRDPLESDVLYGMSDAALDVFLKSSFIRSVEGRDDAGDTDLRDNVELDEDRCDSHGGKKSCAEE